jgi:nicotinamide-nucleotide amidase
MFSKHLLDLSHEVVERSRAQKQSIATAESCTGGLVAALITAVPGSSHVFDRGFVTYSNEAKNDMLGVPLEVIRRVGAVSAEVAGLMCEGALAVSRADIAVSVTGIAGPGGGTPEKPVGLVYIAAGRRGKPPNVERHIFPGDRAAVREATAERALTLLIENLS